MLRLCSTSTHFFSSASATTSTHNRPFAGAGRRAGTLRVRSSFEPLRATPRPSPLLADLPVFHPPSADSPVLTRISNTLASTDDHTTTALESLPLATLFSVHLDLDASADDTDLDSALTTTLDAARALTRAFEDPAVVQELKDAASRGEGHIALEKVNVAFTPQAGFTVLREVDELQKVQAWQPAEALTNRKAAAYVVALVAADALARAGIAIDFVAGPAARHHLLIRTRLMGEELPNLEAVLDVGYPWFFAADLPGATPVALATHQVITRLAEAVAVVARAEGKLEMAARALQVMACADWSGTHEVVREMGLLLADRAKVEGNGNAEGDVADARAYLEAYVKNTPVTRVNLQEVKEAEEALKLLG